MHYNNTRIIKNMNHHCYYVYILLCSDGSYYTGITSTLEKRLDEHHSGFYPSCYTFSRRPLKLVFTEAYQFAIEAIGGEKQIKGWSRQKKEALITSNEEILPTLSKNKTRGSD